MKRLMSRRSLAAMLTVGSVARSAEAASLPVPQDRPILVVSGLISHTNDGAVARFDRPMLEALGTQGFVTSTPWYNGLTRFDGVSMWALMRAVGAAGTQVTAVALNDYRTEIPLSDFENYNVLLALKRDGIYMPVRDKGPLFIIYPFDSNKNLQTRIYFGRSAWQVSQLIVQ